MSTYPQLADHLDQIARDTSALATDIGERAATPTDIDTRLARLADDIGDARDHARRL